jgi:hypothetical protein
MNGRFAQIAKPVFGDRSACCDGEGKMKSMWRPALFAVALLTTAVFLAPPVAAQKGVFGLFPAGTYKLSFAGADFSGSADNLELSSFSVTTGTDVARPDGGPQTTTSDTTIFMFLFDNSTVTFTQVCATLDNPSDFTIDKRLGTATLNTTLTPEMPSCFGTPLTTDIGITASWVGVGPLASSSGASNYACAGYRAASSGVGLTNTASANLALTIDGTTTLFSSSQTGLNSGDSRVEAQGPIDPNCGPAGFGTGPTPAGHFRFNGLFADGFFTPQPGEFDQVSLVKTNQSSQPAGGPAAGTPEFDLNVSLFGGTIDGFGCFAIPQSDFVSNDLTSASVQTTSTGSPLCTNSSPGFGLNFPLTVSATWTSGGPLVTIHDQNNYHCQGYTASTATSVEAIGATSSATVTMPDYFGNPVTEVLTGGFGSLTQVTQNIQANGVLTQACLIRA